MREFKHIQFNTEDAVSEIRMSRPPSNILDFEMMAELSEALDSALSSPFLVLSSSVTHFCMGVDVKIHTPEMVPEMLVKFHRVMRKLYHFPGLSVCVLHGYALGGGLELALLCDFILAEKDAKLGFPEIRLACFPPVASVLLPRIAGRKANEMLFTGGIISAEQAESLGLADAVFEQQNRADFLREFLQKISCHSYDALFLLKKVLRQTSGFDFDGALDIAEKFYLTELLRSPDVAEGIEAFLQKRSPKYRWQRDANLSTE